MISIISSLYKSDRYLDKFSGDLKKFAEDLTRANLLFEVIVIANDPTERERRFEKEFKNQSWFSFVKVSRESLYATWNRGVHLAKGEAVGFWNVDDVRFPEAVIEAKDLFNQSAELVYFPFIVKHYFKIGYWYLPLPARKLNKQISEFNKNTVEQFKNSMFCGPFFMFTKGLYEKVGPFDEQFKVVGDFDWCTRAAYKTERFVKAKSFAGIFRVDGGGLSAGANPRRTAENNVVYVRNHAWNKIVVAEDAIIGQYRPKFVKFHNIFNLYLNK